VSERPTDVHVVIVRVHLKNMTHMLGGKIKDLTSCRVVRKCAAMFVCFIPPRHQKLGGKINCFLINKVLVLIGSLST
jgi:hypothetical protein